LDEPRDTLNPDIWNGDGEEAKLRPEIDKFIRKGISKLLLDTKVTNVFLVGSNTGYRFNSQSDLDVTLIVDTDDETLEKIVAKTPIQNGATPEGLSNPLNFYVLNERPSDKKFDSIYDIIEEKWIKPPVDIGVNLDAVYDEFKSLLRDVDASKSESMRSIIDIELLTKVSGNKKFTAEVVNKLKNKLKVLDASIDEIVSTYDKVHKERIDAFKNYDSSVDKDKYPSPNILPANVRYKLLERYHYLDFMTKLSNLIYDTGDIDTKDDVEKVKKILSDTKIKEEIDSFVDNLLVEEQNKENNSNSIVWKKPRVEDESGEYFENNYTKKQFSNRGLKFEDEKQLTDYISSRGKPEEITLDSLKNFKLTNITSTKEDFDDELKDKEYAKSYNSMLNKLKKNGIELPMPIIFKFGKELYGFAGNRRTNLALRNNQKLKVWMVDTGIKVSGNIAKIEEEIGLFIDSFLEGIETRTEVSGGKVNIQKVSEKGSGMRVDRGSKGALNKRRMSVREQINRKKGAIKSNIKTKVRGKLASANIKKKIGQALNPNSKRK
jgi:hypothetical protein